MEIRFLNEDEFFVLRELLDGVFSRHRGREAHFDKAFPRLFATPNEYVTSSHLGAFDGDRLIGTAALYKLDYVVGTEHIKLIGNGNVAVHEDYRGQGVMSKLLDAVNDECDKIGDVGYLHGKPERYGRWGYIGNGIQYELTFEPTDDNYEFVTMTDSHVDFCRELSHKKVDYILRKREDFEPSLRSGGREAVSVIKNGNLVGFVSLNRDNAFVEESAFDGSFFGL